VCWPQFYSRPFAEAVMFNLCQRAESNFISQRSGRFHVLASTSNTTLQSTYLNPDNFAVV